MLDTSRSLTNPVLGVDACKGGWIGISLPADDTEPIRALFAGHIADLVAKAQPSVVAIDIPIGLPERGRRAADGEARDAIGPRRSSVFTTPVRAALAEETHARANAVNRDRAGEGMSVQAFGLFPKIREVDAWRRTATPRVVEVHPEVSFRRMADAPLAHPKKTWAGVELRRGLLADEGIVLPADLGPAGGEAAVDDVLDAAAAAWTARRVARGVAESLPARPETFDDWRVAIWR